MAKNAHTVSDVGAEEEKFSAHLINQWYFHACDCAETCTDADINILDAWRITRGDPKVTIAFLDSQIENDYPHIGHGALCAGIACGKFGVAPLCSTLLIKAPLQAGDDVLLEIFKETSKKAHIICCAWAPTPIYRPLAPNLFNCLTEIAHKGGPQEHGCLICFAAGNYNAPVKDLENKEFTWLDESIDHIRTTKGPIENGFASHPDVITVAASTSLNTKANYSNWGSEIDLCAPSNNFHPFSKRFNVEGRRELSIGNDIFRSDQLSQFGGTSFATALVAGVAALVRCANGGLNALTIKKILEETTDKISNDAYNPITGKSNWFGHGKVNAGKAVAMAIRNPSK